MKKIIDIVSLSLVAVVVGGIAVLNVAQAERPTVSEMENRKLAEMPEFTLGGLFDGSYFKGISAYISDTFPERDQLVALSKKMDVLKGFDYKIGDGGSFVVLDPTGNKEETTDPSVNDKLDQAFENLNNPDKNDPKETDKKETTPSVPGIIEIETDAPETTAPETSVSETYIPETASPETNVSETNIAETQAPETEPPETTPQYTVWGLTLSKETVSLTVGSGTVLHAYLNTDNPTPDNVKWSVTDSNIVSLALNPNGGIDVKALAEGTCTIRCRYGDEVSASCEVTVKAIDTTPPKQEVSADFLTNGMFIYGDAVHTPAYYSAANASYYARTAAYYKSLFGAKTRMNVVVAPVSSMVVDNEQVKATIGDQGEMLSNMAALMDPSVNFVDVYSVMYEHRNEYLFFKSDHHWTQLGAYYAYVAYAKSVGLTPTPLSAFEKKIINSEYRGSMYTYTRDERVKNFVDTIEAYFPTKAHTMTITDINGQTHVFNSSII